MVVDKLKNKKADTAFQLFVISVKKCLPWSQNEVCLNNAHCHYKVNIPHRFMTSNHVTYLNRIKCKCVGKYSYICGKNQKYCATNKGACDRLNTTSTKIKKCKN